MSSLSTDERIRARIRGLVRHGDGVNEAYSAQRRAPAPGLSAKNLSYFLHDRRKAPLSLADLEDIALYYNLTPDDLYYPTRTHKGLSPPKGRPAAGSPAATRSPRWTPPARAQRGSTLRARPNLPAARRTRKPAIAVGTGQGLEDERRQAVGTPGRRRGEGGRVRQRQPAGREQERR